MNQVVTNYVSGRESWKRNPRYKEVEVSNLGRVRIAGERTCVEPYFDKTYGQWRVTLKLITGVAKVNVANLVADCYIGPRERDMKVVHINGKVDDNTAVNLRYEKFKYPPRQSKPKQPAPVPAESLPAIEATVTELTVTPEYVVLGVGEMILTADKSLAIATAALSKMDVYRLERKEAGSMTVWVLGEKVE